MNESKSMYLQLHAAGDFYKLQHVTFTSKSLRLYQKR